MAESEPAIEPREDQPEETGLERGTYEVIRNRLANAGKQLRTRLEQLNTARKDVFGAIETTLLATERITTSNNCVARDMTPVGDRFLFGYNVHIGLKTETALEDVFAVHEVKDNTFVAQDLALINDERFLRDFRELFRYYKKTVFVRFAVIGPHLHMVFRISDDVRDVKTFKWLIQDEALTYVDARSDHEYRFPSQHGFEWIRTHRDMFHHGKHPHVSIEDRLFVETVGGDLTIKIENNTDSGQGIYTEHVDNPDQTLDDAEIYYAVVANLILLKIRPYQEEKYRYLVYSEKTRQVARLDSIEDACVLLPDGHGLIFSNGYFLQTGEYKIFESDLSGMLFTERVASPNGEDYLYVFYNRLTGVYICLAYNLIEQRVHTPVVCSGYSFYEDGRMIYFKAQSEPQRHHALQIWQTPYVGQTYQPATQTDSLLFKIGNPDIVRGMAECHEVLGLIAKEDTYANLFVDLAKKVGDLLDAYYWLDSEETFDLRSALETIKQAADAAISEFEKVTAVRENTNRQINRIVEAATEITSSIHARRFEVIDDFVASLVSLRTVRGEIISLKSLRYVDTARIEDLEAEVQEHTDRIAKRCVEFLLRPESLKPYEKSVVEHGGKIDALKTVAEARKLEELVATSASELEMLIEIVSNLKIDDATQRTAIIDSISDIFSQLNQTRAGLKNRMQELARTEGVAEFNSQLKLLNQGVVNYLDVCDTPDKCEQYLTKMMIQIEELDGRFAEFDEFVVQLAEKREEIYNAFESRKVQLVEARNRRVTALAAAADRILKGVKSRVDGLKTVNEINGYFAADLMIEKLRDIVDDMGELGDTVKVDDIQSRMKTIREDAVRQLKDRRDLYEDGDSVIRLGEHRFSVNNQAFDITTIQRDGRMFYHLTGTNYFDLIDNAELAATQDVWRQEVVSENADVYRAEYLAYRLFRSLGDEELPKLEEVHKFDDQTRLELVQRFMGPRYAEGYVKGVHDHDAAKILQALVEAEASVGLLRYHPQARAMASAFWFQFPESDVKGLTTAKLAGFGAVRELFPETDVESQYVAELRELLDQWPVAGRSFPSHLLDSAAEYLFHELSGANGDIRFVISGAARDLYQAFQAYLAQKFFVEKYQASLADVRCDANEAFGLLRGWVEAFLATRGDQAEEMDYADEVAALLLTDSFDVARVVEASVRRELTGMVGNHRLIQSKAYRLNYNTFMVKLGRFSAEVVPRFEAFGRLKKELVESERERMRLDEFRPRVLTSFVRNKLIDQVYLPLIGDNLAKQLGVVGEAKRTDRMGLLLLISPPGYGKTTLMEYMANRLGIVFMKVNGPALGYSVTSLDPAEAPNAAAREEIEKLNLAFEMGDNVMIYLDDIQHCNPELLQKFISLCDAQRKIEGVHRGKTRTYDLRGKKVAVVMAGNPYTESGEKFKIPDMLANRADTYNLGEIIGPSEDVFHLSYLENSLTSNPVLNKLASRSQADVYTIIAMAGGEPLQEDKLEGSYSLAEINEMVSVMRKLIQVRNVILRVNAEYIRSAGMADEYRTEPPFKLQGSYRNMNRLAERVVAVMNDQELDELILSSYENDSQTLTTGAESNMLKFKEMTGRLTEEETERWESIKRTFGRNVQLAGVGDDVKFGQMIVQLTSFSDGLDAIRKTLDSGVGRLVESELQAAEQEQERAPPEETRLTASFDAETLDAMRQLVEQMRSAATEETSLTASFDAETLDAMRQLVEQMKSTAAEAVAQAAPAAQQPEIHLVSKVPRSILNILREQFRIMHTWLEPLHRESVRQNKELAGLQKTLSGSMEKYDLLIKRLEEAIQRGDLTYETLAKNKVRSEQSRKARKKGQA